MKISPIQLLIWAVCVTFTCTAEIQSNDRQDNHRISEPLNKVYVIAHRGAHDKAPENSLPAYQKAVDMGCDYVEIDVRITQDGRLVSFHNGNLDAYGIKSSVEDLSLNELRKIDIGEKCGKQWKHTRIPTVDEIFQLCKGKISVYLDLKTAPIDSLMKYVQKYGMENQVLWYIPFSHFKGKPNFNLYVVLQKSFLMPDTDTENFIDSIFAQNQVSMIASDIEHIDSSFVQKVHTHNALLFVDDRYGTIDEWKKMIDLGVDGIQTDHPQELITLLKK
ncbi:MAG: hypothetical protein H6Q14_2305 [Bacteroidetes bacterium]|nr:hypothetical protein [Bacteroidota bacterium]